MATTTNEGRPGMLGVIGRMADSLAGIDAGDVWQRFTCSELDSIAEVLRWGERREVADFITAEHAMHDEPGDTHYDGDESELPTYDMARGWVYPTKTEVG